MDKIIFYLFLFSVVGQEGLCKTKKHRRIKPDDAKIVGGYNTTIEAVPYQAYLLLLIGTDYYQCGGSIISTKYILTAAHCLTGVSRISIRVGSTSSDSGGQTYATSLYRQHPQYNARTSDYDVGVILVPNGIKLNNVTSSVVTLADNGTDVPSGQELLVTGWGATSENGATTSHLLAVTVQTYTEEQCRQSYNSLTDRMFCAGVPEGGKDSCQGDSGGPAILTSTKRQVGIVSYGIGCARPGIPGVYTKVSAVRRWIRTTTGV